MTRVRTLLNPGLGRVLEIHCSGSLLLSGGMIRAVRNRDTALLRGIDM